MGQDKGARQEMTPAQTKLVRFVPDRKTGVGGLERIAVAILCVVNVPNGNRLTGCCTDFVSFPLCESAKSPIIRH